MRPDENPGAIINDIWTTITTGQITGFVWPLIAFAIIGGALWLVRRMRDWFDQRRMDKANREEAARHAAMVEDAPTRRKEPMPQPPELDAIGAEFDAKIDAARSAAIHNLAQLVMAGEISHGRALSLSVTRLTR